MPVECEAISARGAVRRGASRVRAGRGAERTPLRWRGARRSARAARRPRAPQARAGQPGRQRAAPQRQPGRRMHRRARPERRRPRSRCASSIAARASSPRTSPACSRSSAACAARRPPRRSSDTGLGLPFCKLAVELMGGRIGVDSTPGVETSLLGQICHAEPVNDGERAAPDRERPAPGAARSASRDPRRCRAAACCRRSAVRADTITPGVCTAATRRISRAGSPGRSTTRACTPSSASR